jgi:hypothetical protein
MLKGKEVISDPHKQYEIARNMHAAVHGGINKTTASIAEKYHWVRIKETVSTAIRNCVECKETAPKPETAAASSITKSRRAPAAVTSTPTPARTTRTTVNTGLIDPNDVVTGSNNPLLVAQQAQQQHQHQQQRDQQQQAQAQHQQQQHQIPPPPQPPVPSVPMLDLQHFADVSSVRPEDYGDMPVDPQLMQQDPHNHHAAAVAAAAAAQWFENASPTNMDQLTRATHAINQMMQDVQQQQQHHQMTQQQQQQQAQAQQAQLSRGATEDHAAALREQLLSSAHMNPSSHDLGLVYQHHQQQQQQQQSSHSHSHSHQQQQQQQQQHSHIPQQLQQQQQQQQQSRQQQLFGDANKHDGLGDAEMHDPDSLGVDVDVDLDDPGLGDEGLDGDGLDVDGKEFDAGR